MSNSQQKNNVLSDVKKLLGMEADYTDFDTDIILHINSVIMTLNQLGLKTKVNVIDSKTLWEDIYSSTDNMDAIPVYVYMKTRLVFDPPSSGYVTTALTQAIDELTWRLREQLEINKQEVTTNDSSE